MWFDENTYSFVPLLHKRSAKSDALSMEYLQKTHKVKAKRTMKAEDMKRECFFYTQSQSNPVGCDTDNDLKLQKYQYWLNYYLYRESEPMRKLRQFQP